MFERVGFNSRGNMNDELKKTARSSLWSARRRALQLDVAVFHLK